MFLQRLMSQTNGPVLEQVLEFTAARHKLIAENMANVDTPGYLQKDLDLRKFQSMLRDRVEHRGDAQDATGFEDMTAELEHPRRGILFHDGNNRSMEQLTSDLAKNAMMHNMVIELLRKQYQQMDMALKERVT
jgi:flagellar basal-body rod protein FlgB